MSSRKLVATATFFGFVLVGSIEASADPHCGQFVVFESTEEGQKAFQYVDNAEPGIGAGDVHLVRSQLVDENENEIGVLFIHSTVMPGGQEGAYPAIGTGHYVFEDGTITNSAPHRLTDPTMPVPADEEFGPIPEEVVAAVIGGDRAFAGARGTFSAYVDDRGRRAHAFDIVCLE